MDLVYKSPVRAMNDREVSEPVQRRYRVTGWLSTPASWVIAVYVLATVALVYPLLWMQPTTTASQDPGGSLFEAHRLATKRFASRAHRMVFIVEARNGNLLEQAQLAELLTNSELLRQDPRLEFDGAQAGSDPRHHRAHCDGLVFDPASTGQSGLRHPIATGNHWKQIDSNHYFLLEGFLRYRLDFLHLADAVVLKREPGESPGLPRSGKWERKPSIKHWPMVGWEATVSRN